MIAINLISPELSVEITKSVKKKNATARMRKFRIAHPGVSVERSREYRKTHPEWVKASSKLYYERVKADPVRWKKHTEHQVKNIAKRRVLDPDGVNKVKREWRAKHPDHHLKYYIPYAYGISLEDYKAMLVSQKGLCAACGSPPRGKHRLHIDHNHQTGKVRELLCHECNIALGCVAEDPVRLQKLAEYIIRHKR